MAHSCFLPLHQQSHLRGFLLPFVLLIIAFDQQHLNLMRNSLPTISSADHSSFFHLLPIISSLDLSSPFFSYSSLFIQFLQQTTRSSLLTPTMSSLFLYSPSEATIVIHQPRLDLLTNDLLKNKIYLVKRIRYLFSFHQQFHSYVFPLRILPLIILCDQPHLTQFDNKQHVLKSMLSKIILS